MEECGFTDTRKWLSN